MAHVLQTDTHRRLRSVVRACLLTGLVWIVFGVAGTRPAVSVEINDQPVTIFDRTPVEEVLVLAGVEVRYGALHSAVDNVLLEEQHNPPQIRINGRRSAVSTVLRQQDRVVAEDGPDALEDLETERIVVPAGLPEVEHRLWHTGRDGVEEVVKGAISGEIVSRTTIVEMVPATPEERPVVSLTFDDGPDPRWTVPILENLRREGIKAMFCVVGRQARRYPELIAAIVADGHILCDHSETHPVGLSRLSRSEIDLEVGSPSFYLQTLTGTPPAFFRAPGGSINELVVSSAHSRGMRILGWGVDPRDFEGPAPDEIQRRVMSSVKPGSVILLHDGGGIRSKTVAALPGLITQLKAAGYGFRTP